VRAVFDLVPPRMQLLCSMSRKASAEIFPSTAELLATILGVNVEARRSDANKVIHFPAERCGGG
jgi:hypothetical protein